jgi:xylose dehydrogenase (NAD/NADP)
MASAPLRIGILGAANIARLFTAGLAPSTRVRVAAVASRSAAKAEQFARENGIDKWHGSYHALLADPEIDAIYIPLPNTLHAEWSIRAAEAGKHILCEKPLAVTAADARAMFDAARKNSVRLVEAYPYRAQPQTLKLRELLDSGQIGQPQFMQASFAVIFTDPANIRMDPALGGGALLDAGSYVVSLIRMVAGERPSRVSAIARWQDSGVDRTMSATIEFATGFIAQMSCSFGAAYHRHVHIAGDAGTMQSSFLNHPPLGGPPTVRIQRGTTAEAPSETIETAGGNGFLLEAESFQRMLTQSPDQWNGVTEAESMDIIMTLEAIAESARSGHAVDLP